MPVPEVLIALRRILPSLIGPPLATYLASRALHAPLLLAVPLSILSLPLFFFASAAWRRFQNARAAERLGARLLPWVKDDSWIGLGAMRAQFANFKSGYLGEHLFGWAESLGWTFQLNVLLEDVVFTSEPEYIKAILATNFNGFKKNTEARFLTDLLGDGVFNANGDVWKFHRGITRPFFSRDRITDFEVFDHHALLALTALRKRLDEGQPIDFQDLVSRFTIDSATDFLFGADVRSLDAGLPYPGTSNNDEEECGGADAFARAFIAAQVHIAARSRVGLAWSLFEIGDTKHAKNLRTIRNFVEPLVEKAVERAGGKGVEGGGKEVEEGETMLDYMVKQTRDPVLLRDETLNILLAGRDTTASLLTSTLYALSQNPSILSRLRSEILSTVGSSRAPTPDDIRQMKFLRAVLNETMRLWPPVPFNARMTTEPTLWPSKIPGERPFYIPANTRTMYSVLCMHRRTDLWGSDALKFDPDRFIDERVKYLTSNNFIFLPFNAGPRICLGQQFAYNEASFFLVRLLQSYDGVELALDVQPEKSKPRWGQEDGWMVKEERSAEEKVWMKSHLTLYVEGGMWVRLRKASQDEVVESDVVA